MNEIFWGLLCIAASVAWTEFTEWAPWLAQRILNATVKQFPESQQERMSEELSGLLNEAPGKLWKLWTATSLWWGFSRSRLLKQFHEEIEEAALRGLDLFSALLLLIAFFPVCLIAYLAIRLTTEGPAITWLDRIGKDGKPFKLYIFQTIKPNSENILFQYLWENEDEMKLLEEFEYIKKDPRNTPVGNLLAKFGGGSFPQILNLLKGDVSIIGARPCSEYQQQFYGHHWETYCKVKPGLIRAWDFNKDKFLSNAQRIELDIEHIKNRSLWKTIVRFAKIMTTRNTKKATK